MWIALALLAAVGSAGTSLMLKRAVGEGGAVVSTVVFRSIAGLLVGIVFTMVGTWPPLTPEYWRTLALVIPPEIGGMLFLSLALRSGELSLVQPIMGLIPLAVMAGGVIFLNETPSKLAGLGIVLVALGLYCVGLRRGASALEPFRAMTRSKSSWYALIATLFWTVTSLLHKVGIGLVGPLPWASSLTLGSALVLGCSLPFVAWKTGSSGVPLRVWPWARFVMLAGVCFAFQQVGLHNALAISQAGYVIALASMSIIIATTLGVMVLGEESGGHRIAGAALVASGVGLIALFG